MRMLSTEQLLSLVNGLGAIVWEAEPETFRYTFVSEEAERILGYPARTISSNTGCTPPTGGSSGCATSCP